MKPTHSLAVVGLAVTLLGGGLTAASAQTFTVTSSVSGSAPTFTYSYLVTPVAGSLGVLMFNFSDANVTAGTEPSGFTNLFPTPPGLGAGIFEFASDTPGGTTAATTFTFTSPDMSGGTLGATNTSIAPNSSGVAAVTDLTPAPAAAPEPSQNAALGLGVLGLCFLAFTARKRNGIIA
jgi:hypothetical protein